VTNQRKVKKSNRWLPTESESALYEIISKADSVLKGNPDDLNYLKVRGIALHKLCFYDQKHINDAIKCFNKILQIEPSNKEFLKRKGYLFLRKETIEQATQCFDEVLNLDSKDSEALGGKGVALQIEGKPYLAVSYFDKALDIDPFDAEIWMQKGYALSARGETWDKAIECFDKALEINFDDVKVWKGKASVLHKKGSLDDAILCYDKAIALDPRDFETLMLKGYALTGIKKFEEAIGFFDQSLNIKNDNIEALRGKADVLYFSDHFDQAIRIYDTIIQFDPKYAEAWRQKAFCLLNSNRKTEALHCFDKVLEINPEDVKARLEKQKLTEINKEKDQPSFLNQSYKSYSEYAIIVEKITKSFRIYHERRDTVFSLASNLFSKNNYEILKILQNVSFNLKKGEMLGVIGKNGSGKTTLLRILSGILKPDSGKVTVNGTVAPLLQLGVGFNGELTARENIILAGMLLGFPKKEMISKVNSIIEFAELEKFLDTKIKNFSNGMHARLAFSTAIQVDPDILLIDEILAVGDINFVKKSYREFLSFREKGKSIIFVSHSLDHIRNLCDRAMILDSSEIKMIGSVDQVVDHYIQSNN
jgi:lipopolysaccharide transport system ATP-binding protein